jgi:hypothetical protein
MVVKVFSQTLFDYKSTDLDYKLLERSGFRAATLEIKC